MCILPSIPLLCTSKTTSRPHPANRCASLTHDGDRIDTRSGPSADKNRVDQWTPKEAEAGYEEDQKGETEGNGERSDCDTPLLLRFTKKRPLSSGKKKPRVKRRVKRRRFSSSFSSDEATATENESDISSYTSFRPLIPQDLDLSLLSRPALRSHI